MISRISFLLAGFDAYKYLNESIFLLLNNKRVAVDLLYELMATHQF
jgi:hypothetical protein